MCHTRELAFQISKEYERFSKYMPTIKVSVFFGGLNIGNDEKVLKTSHPHIVVGTPGRILALVRSKKLNLKNLKHFILDECDKMLEQLGKRSGCRRVRPVTDVYVALRHAPRRSRDLQVDSPRKASDDVLRDTLEGHSASLQEVHARRKHRPPFFVAAAPCPAARGDLMSNLCYLLNRSRWKYTWTTKRS